MLVMRRNVELALVRESTYGTSSSMFMQLPLVAVVRHTVGFSEAVTVALGV